MSNIKKAKSPKRPKPPKPVFKDGNKKSEKKLEKQLKKENRQLNKKLERRLGIFAVLLCITSSVLDIVSRNKSKSDD